MFLAADKRGCGATWQPQQHSGSRWPIDGPRLRATPCLIRAPEKTLFSSSRVASIKVAASNARLHPHAGSIARRVRRAERRAVPPRRARLGQVARLPVVAGPRAPPRAALGSGSGRRGRGRRGRRWGERRRRARRRGGGRRMEGARALLRHNLWRLPRLCDGQLRRHDGAVCGAGGRVRGQDAVLGQVQGDAKAVEARARAGGSPQ